MFELVRGGIFRRPIPERYEDYLTIFGTRFTRALLVLALVSGFIAVLFSQNSFLVSTLTLICISAIAAIGMHIVTGLAGQVSLGHAFFIGLGAYTAGYLGSALSLPFIVWLPGAGIIAALASLTVGPFAVRLRGLYLAIATMGLVFVGQHLFVNWTSVTGGPRGHAVPPPQLPGLNFAEPLTLWNVELGFGEKFLVVTLVVAVVAGLTAANLRRRRFGRALRALRQNDIAASVIGVDITRYKYLAFAVSALYAGVAGALWGSYVRVIVPESFDMLLSVQFVAMIIIGGMDTVLGAVLGAAFVLLMPLGVGEAASLTGIPTTGRLRPADVSSILYGLMIVGFLLFEPAGLAGLWFRLKTYFRSWPFTY